MEIVDLFYRLRRSLFCRSQYALLNFLKLTASYWPAKLYLQVRYRVFFGHKLNLDNPQTFNEKLQWLKLYYCPDSYSLMVDKYNVKQYVAKIIGEEHIIPTLGVWDDAAKIDFNKLPNQFVLKCNHNSGKGMYICTDKQKCNIQKVREGLRKGLKEKFYKMSHEMQYKNVKPLILAEKFMESDDGKALIDYKFFCFDGVVKICHVISGRYSKNLCGNFYDLDWNLLPFGGTKLTNNSSVIVERPQNLEKMIEMASLLSKGIPFVRVDLYNINGKIYFGELTFTPTGGMDPFTSDDWDYKIGSWLKLPKPTKKVK